GGLTIGICGNAQAATLHRVLQQRHQRRIVVDDGNVDTTGERTGRLNAGDADRCRATDLSGLLHRLDGFVPEGDNAVAVGLVLRDTTAASDVDAAAIFGEEIQLRDFRADLPDLDCSMLLGAA